MNPLISVIVPIYNVEHYLERCIKSILGQSYRNLEVILVDDGSPDDCPRICDEYAAKDSRIVVIHQINSGLSGARNSGIDAAGGEYLAFVDSDDFIAVDFIETLYLACQETGSDLAQCKYEYVTGDMVTKADIPGDMQVFTGEEMLHNLYIPDGAYFVVAWNKLYKKHLFDGIRFPVGRLHEDEATTYKIYGAAKKAVVVDRFLYGYYMVMDSITRRTFNEKRLDWVWAVSGRLEWFEKHGKTEVMPKAIKAFADACIDFYYKSEVLAECKKHQQELKGHVKNSLQRARAYGGLPGRTAIGYRIFLTSPALYRRLNRRMAEA